MTGARVFWFTGLPAAGKTTLARQLSCKLQAEGQKVYVIDGDELRSGLNADLTYTDHDRSENMRRTMELAKILLSLDVWVIVAMISPFKKDRDLARQTIGHRFFTEIYLSTPLAVCEKRDPKSLYRSARLGLIQHVTGIDSPYEAPTTSDLEIDTTATSVDQSVEKILRQISHLDQ